MHRELLLTLEFSRQLSHPPRPRTRPDPDLLLNSKGLVSSCIIQECKPDETICVVNCAVWLTAVDGLSVQTLTMEMRGNFPRFGTDRGGGVPELRYPGPT